MNTTQCQPEKIQEFDRLLRTEGDSVLRAAHRLSGGHEADARDLAQNAWIRLWRQWDIQRPVSIKGWIYRVLQNLHRDRLRQQFSHPMDSLEVSSVEGQRWEDVLPELTPSPQVTAERTELQRKVQEALSRLEPEFRIPLMLSDMYGLDYDEIAQQMNCPVGTVRSRLHRGRRRMRTLLAAGLVTVLGGWLAIHLYIVHQVGVLNRMIEAKRPPSPSAYRHRVALHHLPDVAPDVQ
jgi:RNA polymerase sigma-70 factor (ECF subfamily)